MKPIILKETKAFNILKQDLENALNKLKIKSTLTNKQISGTYYNTKLFDIGFFQDINIVEGQAINEEVKGNEDLFPLIKYTYDIETYKNENLKIEVLSNINYQFLIDDKYIDLDEKDDCCRINILGINNKINLQKVLEENNAFPACPFVLSAYSVLHQNYFRKFIKENFAYKSIEIANSQIQLNIQSKLDPDNEIPYSQIINILTKKADFELYHNYILQYGSVQQHFEKDGLIAKLAVIGTNLEVTTKENSEIVQDKNGINCIMKRVESKNSKDENIDLTSMTFIGEIYMGKKVAYLLSKNTGRIFHIKEGIVQKTGSGEKAFQIEVEYKGTTRESTFQTQNEIEKEIIDEISDITKLLKENLPNTKYSTVTRTNWIKS